MIKKIDRYIISEFIPPFLGGLLLFCFILLMDKCLKLLDLVLTKGVGIKDILMLFIHIIPPLLSFIIPMSVLFATLMAFGRLASDNEITALLSSGMHPLRLFSPILFLSIFILFFCIWLEFAVIPSSNRKFLSFVSNLRLKKEFSLFNKGEFQEINKNILLYLRNEGDTEIKDTKYNGILIIDGQIKTQQKVIFAQSGNISLNDKDGKLNISLLNGNIHNLVLNDQKGYEMAKFREYCLSFAIPGIGIKKGEKTPYKLLSQRDLSKLSESDSVKEKEKIEILLEMNRRLAFPFACLIFAFIGALIGIFSRWSGKGTSFAISLILILLYYFIMIAGYRLSVTGYLKPALSIWLPNLCFSAFGIWGLKELY